MMVSNRRDDGNKMMLLKAPGLVILCLVLSVNTFAQLSDSIQIALNPSSNLAVRIPILKHIGEWYLSKHDTTALRYFKELLLLSDQSNDPLLKPYAYYRMGVCRYEQSD